MCKKRRSRPLDSSISSIKSRFLSAFMLIVFSSIPLSAAYSYEDKLNCAEISRLIDKRTGIILWNHYPTIGISDKNEINFNRSYQFYMQDSLSYIWKYVSDICGSCRIQANIDPHILVRKISSIQELQGPPSIYVPAEVVSGAKDPDEINRYLLGQVRDGVHVFTSARLAFHDSGRVLYVVRIEILDPATDSIELRDELKSALFQAVTSLSFHSDKLLRSRLQHEISSGCLSESKPDCEIVKFGRFLYQHKMDPGLQRSTTAEQIQVGICDRYSSDALLEK